MVVAAAGYPGTPRTGDPVEGLDAAAASRRVDVIQAGHRPDDDGPLVTAGGRVLAVTASGLDVADARATAYAGRRTRSASTGASHRTDIAARQSERPADLSP